MRRIGLDLALRAPHRAAIFDDGNAVGGSFAVPRNKSGIDDLLRRATAHHEGPCEFIMEPTGLAWLALAAELVRRGHRTYVPKPQKTYALRKFLHNHTKTDGTDARAGALLRHVDPEGVHELQVPSAEQFALQMFVKQRARLVADSSKCKQRVRALLVLAHPLLSEVLGDRLFSAFGRAVLRKHLDPARLVERGRGHLRRLWSEKVRSPVDDQFDKLWSAYEEAVALYADLRNENRLPFDYQHMQHVIDQELDALEFLEQQIAALEHKIRRLYQTVDPAQVLLGVPGIGIVIGAALQALIGDINRFPTVKAFASYTGLVPKTNLTAGEGKPGQRMTKAGSDLIKQYLFLAAETARRRDPELAATYASAIERGKHHNSAIGIVAHKLARHVYAVLKQQAVSGSEEALYRFRRPDDGTKLTEADAVAYVRANYPSKTERARREKAARNFPKTGSPEGATKGSVPAPPTEALPARHSCGKYQEKLVDSP